MGQTAIAFGALLRRYRLAAGLTQEALAERAGISGRAVGDLERDGGRLPRLDTVALLTQALGLSAEQAATLRAVARPQLDPAGMVRPQPPSPSVSPAVRPFLVGRERERALLRGHLEAAMAGRGHLVLVGGEAGIGKTTLVADLATQAENQGCLVLWGHAFDLTVTPPYDPWVELATGYQPTDDLPPFPAFLHGGPALGALGSQGALFAQTWAFFATVAGKRPLVLMLEDVHWADQESLDLLRFVARQVTRHRMLVLATYRSDELARRHPLSQLIPLVVREAQANRLDVLPLDEDAQRALIEERYRLPEPDLVRLQRYLREHGEGNPLYVGEVLRMLEDGRVLAVRDGAWELGDLAEVRVPPLLVQVIEGRLWRLHGETRALLEVAAVIGQEVPLDLWQRVSGATDEMLARAVEEGLEAHLLTEGAGGAVRFSHALVREALYEGIVLVRRRVWHRTVGEALAASHSPGPDMVAYHFEQAGDPRAVDWMLRAATRAARTFALRAAVARLEVVLRLQETHGVRVAAPQTLLLQMSMLLRFTDPRAALGHVEAALALAERVGDRAFAAVALGQRGYLRRRLGEMRDGMADLELAAQVFDRLLADDPAAFDDAEPRMLGFSFPDAPSFLWGLVALRRDVRISSAAMLGQLERALTLGEPLVDAIFARMEAGEISSTAVYVDVAGSGPHHSANIAHGLGIAYALLGRVAEAHRFFRHAGRLFEAQGIDPILVSTNAEAELELLHLPYEAERLRERQRLVERTQATWARAGDSVPLGLTMPPFLPVLLLEGAWQEARDLAEACRRVLVDNLVWLRLTATEVLAILACEQGEGKRIVAYATEVLPDGPATEPGDADFFAAQSLQRLAARQAFEDRDLPMTRAWLEAHDRWLGWSGAVLGRADGALLWAAYHHAAGDPPLARQRAEEALALASEPRQPLALVAVHRFIGKLGTGDGASPTPRRTSSSRSPWPTPAPPPSSGRLPCSGRPSCGPRRVEWRTLASCWPRSGASASRWEPGRRWPASTRWKPG